jgi:hypothetical protein
MSSTEWAQGIEAATHALLSEGAEADALYLQAIDQLGRSRVTVLANRAQLAYGEWLRREQRRVDARAQLKAAHAAFEAMGAHGFAERARRELLATGETARKRTVDTRDDLTTGSADRATRGRAPDESRDRRAAISQPPHDRVPPAKGLLETRRELAQGARGRPLRSETRARTRLIRRRASADGRSLGDGPGHPVRSAAASHTGTLGSRAGGGQVDRRRPRRRATSRRRPRRSPREARFRRRAAADLDRTGEAVRSVAALATERGAERFPLRCREAI